MPLRHTAPFRALLRAFASATDGTVMAMTAIILPTLAGATLFAVDTLSVTQQVAALQRAADRSALAAARELRFVTSGRDDVDKTLTAIAHGYALESLHGGDLATVAGMEDDTIVTVELALTVNTPFGTLFGGDRTLTARAKAELFTARNICVISTEIADMFPGIALENHAEIRAGTCGIYSNSPGAESIRVENSARIDAPFICSAGGYRGGERSFSTGVITDCPQVTDPLHGRALPPVAQCDATLPRRIEGGDSVNLEPGTYCGGLTIRDNADVWFAPGVYVFRDGPLVIEGEAVVAGENVGLFFDDAPSYFEFRGNADIALSAPETGPMAGILVSARSLCEKSDCWSPRQFTITSAKVRSLLGTINLPQDDLLIDTTMPVSEDAAFTILIIDNLVMKQSTWLVLNTDYAATSVPVPQGFAGPTSTRLVE